MKKKVLLLDLDDTINTLVPTWINLYNQDYNDNLQLEDIKTWDIQKYVKPTCGMKIYDYVKNPKLFENLDIQPNAQRVIEWLHEYFEIFVVTAFKPEVVIAKTKWILEKLPFINPEHICFVNKKGLLKADYIIDDAPHNLKDFKNTNPLGLPIIFNMPWNRTLKNKFPRVSNWLEIEQFFKNILKINI